MLNRAYAQSKTLPHFEWPELNFVLKVEHLNKDQDKRIKTNHLCSSVTQRPLFNACRIKLSEESGIWISSRSNPGWKDIFLFILVINYFENAQRFTME